MVKVQTKLLVLLAVTTILFLSGMLVIRQVQYNGIASLVAARTIESEVLLAKLIKLKGDALSNFANDYTYWDEMVTFVQKGDPDWAKENIDSSLAIYNADTVWIFQPDYSPVYATCGSEVEADTSILPVPLSRKVMAELFAHERLIHVFVQTAQGLMEICGATIHPTADKERHTPPSGYFLAGRVWDQAELDELAELIGGKITLHTPPRDQAFPGIGLEGTITIYRSLAGRDGRPIAQVRADLPSPLTRLAEQALHLDFWLFAFFIVLLSAAIFSLIMLWVVVPLRQIAGSLDAENPDSIQKLKNEKTEFGHIAQLIELSFRQKTALVAEITGRKQLEAQLLQAQKMDAIGRLAGGVAHDFNNLLMVITGYTELLMTHTDGRPCPHQDLEQIQRAAQRAASLTRQLLAFSRRQVLQTSVVDLNEIVHDIQKMLTRLIGEDVELATVLDPHLCQVRVDSALMEQVIMNLAINARDAMPAGGRLSIETKNVFLDESYAGHHLDTPIGSAVMLAISDTGHGMDHETMKHIFEPFFTTKGVGEGTGLGLATVHGIVTQSGGRILVYSEPGHGTTFKIYLPLAQREKVNKVKSEPWVTTGGAETVLVVEDEEVLRTLVKRVLEDHGYTVLSVQNGPAAIAMCRQAITPIDLLLTDMIMPGGLNGAEVARKLRGLYPEMKVIYMSGYTNHVLVDRALLGGGAAFLQKPFTPEVLLRELRKVLVPFIQISDENRNITRKKNQQAKKQSA